MRWLLALTVPVFLLAATAEMSAGEFLAKMEKARSKGALALLSSEFKVLKAEGKRVTGLYRSELVRQKKEGLPPHSCPPEKAKLDIDELQNHLKSLSPAQKKQSFRKAFFGLMKKKYPC